MKYAEDTVLLTENIDDIYTSISIELRAIIEIGRSSLMKMKQLFCNRILNNISKMRMLRCYIFSILLQGIEANTLTKAMTRKTEVLEM